MEKTINEVNEDELVENGAGEYARKKYCIHRNPYYAYIGTYEDAGRLDYTEDEIDNAPIVSDWDDISVEECCG